MIGLTSGDPWTTRAEAAFKASSPEWDFFILLTMETVVAGVGVGGGVGGGAQRGDPSLSARQDKNNIEPGLRGQSGSH